MRFAVDAHAIGRHLTGNEVYVRSLLNAFAAQGQDDEFIAYVSAESAALCIPVNIRTRRIATNPFLRLGSTSFASSACRSSSSEKPLLFRLPSPAYPFVTPSMT